MSSIFLNKDYIHVKDFVNFSIMVAMLRPRNKVVFECGTGNVFKIDKFKKLMINFLPQLKNELLSLDESLYQEKPEKILFSNPLIMKELVSWEPTISLETGFKEIFCWIQKFVILYPEYFKHKEDLIRLEIKNSGFY
jgi:nucleoside-diphosphate-sugar epimerase